MDIFFASPPAMKKTRIPPCALVSFTVAWCYFCISTPYCFNFGPLEHVRNLRNKNSSASMRDMWSRCPWRHALPLQAIKTKQSWFWFTRLLFLFLANNKKLRIFLSKLTRCPPKKNHLNSVVVPSHPVPRSCACSACVAACTQAGHADRGCCVGYFFLGKWA